MTAHIDIDELEDRFAQFMRLHRSTAHRYFRSVGLYNGHPAMLFHIRRHPGLTQKELAARMEISPGSVAISIRRMESAGLVERRRDPEDARVIHLHLTPEGERMDAACAHGRDFMMGALYRGLSPEDRDTLYRLLGTMTENLQDACRTLPEEENV